MQPNIRKLFFVLAGLFVLGFNIFLASGSAQMPYAQDEPNSEATGQESKPTEEVSGPTKPLQDAKPVIPVPPASNWFWRNKWYLVVGVAVILIFWQRRRTKGSRTVQPMIIIGSLMVLSGLLFPVPGWSAKKPDCISVEPDIMEVGASGEVTIPISGFGLDKTKIQVAFGVDLAKGLVKLEDVVLESVSPTQMVVSLKVPLNANPKAENSWREFLVKAGRDYVHTGRCLGIVQKPEKDSEEIGDRRYAKKGDLAKATKGVEVKAAQASREANNANLAAKAANDAATVAANVSSQAAEAAIKHGERLISIEGRLKEVESELRNADGSSRLDDLSARIKLLEEGSRGDPQLEARVAELENLMQEVLHQKTGFLHPKRIGEKIGLGRPQPGPPANTPPPGGLVHTPTQQ